MLEGSLYMVGLSHVETGHRITVGLVLGIDTDLQVALKNLRAKVEETACGYDVEFAVGMHAFNWDYSRTWPEPSLGFAE